MRKIYRISLLTLMIVFLSTLISCTPNSINSAQKKMSKLGYNVGGTMYPEEDPDQGFIGEFYASKYDDIFGTEDFIYAAYYSSTKKASEEMKKINAQYTSEELKKNNFQQSGKWIYSGTDKAIKDFKKFVL